MSKAQDQQRRSPKSNETRARMAATRICRVLGQRPESDWEVVYAEKLEEFDQLDVVLNVMESADENPLGVESLLG